MIWEVARDIIMNWLINAVFGDRFKLSVSGNKTHFGLQHCVKKNLVQTYYINKQTL